ncbi:hypothetical protein EST38_g12313 [Candolleomyces aberdarensis]|uniref:Uncharacterized protein n=1 Tax=Candolleomyces aberdarensis TaxID=2316362 RepID=A0A4Q2D473_9AGAR|nr:hypothetical protein EST38_g12313 [Candolleomyces aberdarensis]
MRPRIHFTPEEIANAGRLKSKRYYDENKETINRRRRKRRAIKAAERKKTQEPKPKGTQAPGDGRGGKKSDIDIIKGRVLGIYDSFKETYTAETEAFHLQEASQRFVDRHREDSENAWDVFDRYCAQITEDHAQLRKYYNMILNLVGVGEDLNWVEGILDELAAFTHKFDGLFEQAVLDPEQFLHDFEARKLDFQTK